MSHTVKINPIVADGLRWYLQTCDLFAHSSPSAHVMVCQKCTSICVSAAQKVVYIAAAG